MSAQSQLSSKLTLKCQSLSLLLVTLSSLDSKTERLTKGVCLIILMESFICKNLVMMLRKTKDR